MKDMEIKQHNECSLRTARPCWGDVNVTEEEVIRVNESRCSMKAEVHRAWIGRMKNFSIMEAQGCSLMLGLDDSGLKVGGVCEEKLEKPLLR